MIQTTILAQLSEYQHLYPDVKCWLVGFSGGVDSTVLLHAVVAANQQLSMPCTVLALHINHQLSSEASNWEQVCRDYAGQLGVEYLSESITVKPQGKGIEAAAREARYRIFDQTLKTGDCLLLGHHQQDQSETLLLRLLRGAGVRGLSAMSPSRRLGQGTVLRPLLGLSREMIQAYAEEKQLNWIEDPSNNTSDYDRNLLRNDVLPQLRQRWPSLDKTLAQTCKRMQHTDQLLNELAEQDLAELDLRPARWGQSIVFKPLWTLSFPRITNLLRLWCRKMGYPVPETEHLQQIQMQFFSTRAQLSQACVSWANTQLRQFSGRLYLMETLPPFTARNEVVEWYANKPLDLKSAGRLEPVSPTEKAHYLCPPLLLTCGDYFIRWRQGGERCTPVGRGRSQTVKKLLQEYQLETWLRDRVPLIYRGDTLVAVGDLWSNETCQKPENQKIHLTWVM